MLNNKIKMEKIKLILSGMHCASCASNIERSLKKVPGIKEVSVSLMLKKGMIELEENSNVTDEDLKKAVARAGYKLVEVERE